MSDFRQDAWKNVLCGFANTGPGSLCLALCLTFGAKGSKLELPTTYIDCHSLPLIELSWTNQLSFSDYIWWVSLHFGGTANILLLCLSFQEHPLVAILFGLCKVQGAYHGHDNHYLLISVEVSLKTASQIVHRHVHRPWPRWTTTNQGKYEKNL